MQLHYTYNIIITMYYYYIYVISKCIKIGKMQKFALYKCDGKYPNKYKENVMRFILQQYSLSEVKKDGP